MVDAVSEFLDLKIARAQKTQAAYGSVLLGAERGTKRPLGLPLAAYFHNRRFDSVLHAEVASWFAQRVKGGAQPTKHRVSKTARAFFRFARERGYTKLDLASAIDPYSAGGPRVEWLTWDEIHSLLDAIGEFRYRLAVAWLFYTGCRVGEACAARQEDVRAIQLTGGGEIYVWAVPDSKTHTPRLVYLPDYLTSLLETSRVLNKPQPHWPLLWDCEGRGFARTENPAYPISPRMINSVLEQARDVTGLTVNVTAHVARHSYCTNWVRRDKSEFSVEKLSRQVGTSPSVLRQTYIHHSVTEADWQEIKAFGTPAA